MDNVSIVLRLDIAHNIIKVNDRRLFMYFMKEICFGERIFYPIILLERPNGGITKLGTDNFFAQIQNL